MRVLYTNGAASMPLAGATATRRIDLALPLRAWWAGDETQAVPLQALRGRALLAVAGLAAPEKFFSMLEAAGLRVERRPLPDHACYDTLPWPAGEARDIVVTEKDAVKLPPARVGKARVWVLRLDLALPAALVRDLLALLPPPDAP
jgi:tetraacyldisaccharide 4'-kinase